MLKRVFSMSFIFLVGPSFAGVKTYWNISIYDAEYQTPKLVYEGKTIYSKLSDGSSVRVIGNAGGPLSSATGTRTGYFDFSIREGSMEKVKIAIKAKDTWGASGLGAQNSYFGIFATLTPKEKINFDFTQGYKPLEKLQRYQVQLQLEKIVACTDNTTCFEK